MRYSRQVLPGLLLLALNIWLPAFRAFALPGSGPTPPVLRLSDLRAWTLVVAAGALPSEQYAAQEFQRLFQLVTGTVLPIATQSSTGGSIYLGQFPADTSTGACLDVSSAGREGVRLRIRQDAIYISGGRPRGVLYAVYEFFERYVGLRFLTADDTYVPEDSVNRPLPIVDYSYDPPFTFRSSDYMENRRDPAFATRLRLNTFTDNARLGGRSNQRLISHSIIDYLPVAVYGRQHPEYYALVNGVRQLSGGGGGPQVCCTNPDVVRIIIAGVEKALAAHPDWSNISVSQMDNDAFCQCPACSALTAQEGTPAASLLYLVNHVAAQIAKTHPGVHVGTLIYWYTRKPPRAMKLEPNVEIQLCCVERCILHPLNDPACERNRVFMQDFERWRQICRHIWLWNYNANFINYDLPFPNLGTIGPDLSLFKQAHVDGVYMEASYNTLAGAFSELHNYVIARNLWHPEAESWPLVEEFCRLHYGPAAPPILVALRYLQTNADSLGLHPRCFAYTPAELGVDARVAHRLYDYLREARRLATNSTIQSRVDQAMIPALKARIATESYTYRDGLYRVKHPTEAAYNLERYAVLTKKFQLTRVGESVSTASYIADMKRLLHGLPAIDLENDTWHLVLLPEQDGRIAELAHKPSGRQLIALPSSRYLRWARWDLWPPSLRTHHPSADAPKRTWSHNRGQAVILTTLPDGSEWKRTVSLMPGGDIRVQMSYKATRAINDWAMLHRPAEFDVSTSESPDNTIIYLRNSSWRQINQAWTFTRSNDLKFPVELPEHFTKLAIYDKPDQAGVALAFIKETFRHLAVVWSPARGYLSFELQMMPVSLEPGQTVTYGYDMIYLHASPITEPSTPPSSL